MEVDDRAGRSVGGVMPPTDVRDLHAGILRATGITSA
jgi:hypothetical protein